MYAIVDIETTGNGIKGNKITEISIFRFDGHTIIDEFTSLVNPECEIPRFITGLTGIDDSMVRNAPTIGQIANRILSITEEAIFVAHSVNFDYNIIKNEFKEIGIEFSRKKLCTVRLARKLTPGHRSYSLGKLCTVLGIPLTDRHRARGDAHATTLLFQALLRTNGADKVFQSFLNARSQEATLPPLLPKSVYNDLPGKPGVYFFKDGRGKIIYIGKAINIKKRVLGHFYDKSKKEIQLCQETAHIDFELSGSELLALIMESEAIKKYYPAYNSAQKRSLQPYGIFSYEDRNGILHLAFNRLRSAPNPITTFYTTTDCRLYLEEVCAHFHLCPKYCHLQENVGTCSHFRIQKCDGICRGTESPEEYNKKVGAAIGFIKSKKEDFIIREKGRNYDEEAFVLVQDNVYMGYGFIGRDNEISSYEDLTAFLIPAKNTMEIQGIIKSYTTRNPDKVVPIPNDMAHTF